MKASKLPVRALLVVLALATTQVHASFAQNVAAPPVTTAPGTFREPVTCQWLANVGAAQSAPNGQSTQGFIGGQFLRARNTTSHVLPRGTRLGWTVRYVRSGQQNVTTRTGTDTLATAVSVGAQAGTSLYLSASIPGIPGVSNATPVTYAIQSCEIIATFGARR